MSENPKPLDFNWINAREQCSLKQVFEDLRLGIREDVKLRNANLPVLPQDHLDKTTLRLVERGNIIRVFWDDDYDSFRSLFVEFDMTRQGIVVRNNEGPLYEFVIGLNDNGDCKLKCLGKEYDPWQVRMKTLEQFMFNVPK